MKLFKLLLILLKLHLDVVLCRDQKLPNVLLIVIDDLRPMLGSYGDNYAVSSNIDHIAENGVVFSNAFAQQALCGPSRTSFLTSRRPDSTKLVDVHSYWRHKAGNFTTLPQYFKEHGYITQSVGKIFHPGIVSNHSDDQPYSWSLPPFHPPSQKFKNTPVCEGLHKNLQSNIYCPVNIKDQPGKTLPDIESTEFALRWLDRYSQNLGLDKSTLKSEERKENKPFFLAVGFHKPHIPLKFPKEFLKLFPISSIALPANRFLPKGLPLVAWNPWNDLRRRDDIAALNVSYPFGPIPDYYSKYLRQGYYASISYVDSLVGLVVSQAKQLFPDTIVAFIGDHGWSLGEHQEWSKFSNFEVSTRVPFIVSLPSEKLFSGPECRYIRKLARTKDSFPQYFRKYIKWASYNSFIKKKMKYAKIKQKTNFQRSNKYDGLVELIDLFPTLVDLAGLPTLPKCSANSVQVETCTEGSSLSCIISSVYRKNSGQGALNCPKKSAVLSQYPRPGIHPSLVPDSDQPRLKETTIMGYSLRESRFRYTRWCAFNPKSFAANCNVSYGDELYDHLYDPGENFNILSLNRNHSAYHSYFQNKLFSFLKAK